MKISFVDSETTGLRPDMDAIIELGVVQIDLANPSSIKHSVSRYNPGNAAISAGAGMIHGIRAQDLSGLPTFRQEGMKQVEPLILTSGILVAHNIDFDGKFIRYGVGQPWDQRLALLKNFCTMREYWRVFDIPQASPIKLGKLSEFAAFPYDPGRAHNALYDALACAACFTYGLSTLKDEARRYNLAHLGLDYIDKGAALEAYSAIIDLHDHQEWIRRSVQTRSYRPTFTRRSVTTDRVGGLLAILADACADGVLELAEIVQIQEWLQNNSDLHNQWPVSEIKNRLEEVLVDGVITPEEQKSLLTVVEHVVLGKVAKSIPGHVANAVSPETTQLAGKSIVLTGDFVFGERAEMEKLLAQKGMVIKNSISKKVDFLLVGSLGSAAYAHGSFGSKFKKAKELHEAGHHIQIIHEKDFPLK